MILEMIYAFFATISFAYVFNAPRKSIFATGIIGSVGWLIFSYFQQNYSASVFGSFAGALVIAILSELAARYYKMPVTVFLTSGIIALVPGGGMYFTMLKLIQKDYSASVSKGTETIFIAGSIAVAIAMGSAVFKLKKKNQK